MFFIFILFSVLRSQMKIVRKSKVNLRECFVAIEPNYAAICMEWLNRRTSHGSSDTAGTSGAQRVQSVQIRGRRASVASCGNMFEIEGTVTEVGFDYLARVPRKNPVIGQQPQKPRNLDAGTSDLSNVSPLGASSAVNSAVEEGREEESSETSETFLSTDLQYSEASDQSNLYSEANDETAESAFEPAEPADIEMADPANGMTIENDIDEAAGNASNIDGVNNAEINQANDKSGGSVSSVPNNSSEYLK